MKRPLADVYDVVFENPHAGDADDLHESEPQRQRTSLCDEIYEMAETQATYMTDDFNWAFKRSKIMFK